MEDSTWITKARYVWSPSTPSGGPRGYGVTGAGIELAMIDTGFDGLHEDGDNLIEYCDTTKRRGRDRRPAWTCTARPGSTTSTIFRRQASADPTQPWLLRTPGLRSARARTRRAATRSTRTSATARTSAARSLGTGHASGGKGFNHSTIGMAPDAKFRAYSANVGPSLLNTQILAAYDDMTYKKEQGYSKVVAVNNSWGGGGGSNYDPSDPPSIAVKRAYDAGIVSVFAAGNSGPEHNTLSRPVRQPVGRLRRGVDEAGLDRRVLVRGPAEPALRHESRRLDQQRRHPAGQPRPPAGPEATSIGLYRPTLAAPGVNINSMKAIAANIGGPIRLELPRGRLHPDQRGRSANCYVQANGTSMATPHVTGAIGLIAQAFKQERGRLPSSAEIIDILERSANTTKLPGWDTEEQGAGRLDVHQAVRYAKGEISLRRPNFGHPTPPYVTVPTARPRTSRAARAAGSWTARDTGRRHPGDAGRASRRIDAFYGQHFITCRRTPSGFASRSRGPNHTGANLYARLWRPGVNPDVRGCRPRTRDATAVHRAAVRVPPVARLARPGGDRPSGRLAADVPAARGAERPKRRTSQPARRRRTAAGDPVGQVGAARLPPRRRCTAPALHRCRRRIRKSSAEGFDYDLKVELPQVTHRPSVKITSSLTGTQDERFVDSRRACELPAARTLPESSARRGTSATRGRGSRTGRCRARPQADSAKEPRPTDTRTVLYMHGNNRHERTRRGDRLHGQGRGRRRRHRATAPSCCRRPALADATPPSGGPGSTTSSSTAPATAASTTRTGPGAWPSTRTAVRRLRSAPGGPDPECRRPDDRRVVGPV